MGSEAQPPAREPQPIRTRPDRRRVVVALTGGSSGEALLRRGAVLAGRGPGGELLAVHVGRGSGFTDAAPGALEAQRALCERLGGTFHRVVGDDVAATLVDFAVGADASLLVLGLGRPRRWRRLLGVDLGAEVVRRAGEQELDVLVVAEPAGARTPVVHRPGVLGVRRRLAGWLLALLGPAALTAILIAAGRPGLATDLLLMVLLTVVTALVGGFGPAIAAAVIGSLLGNYFLTPPLGSLAIANAENAVGLVVGLLVAVAVSSVVRLAARRAVQARRSAGAAETLSLLAGGVLRGEDTVAAVTDRLRSTFGLSRVVLEERDAGSWHSVHRSGDQDAARADEVGVLPVSDNLRLSIAGPALSGGDRRVLEAFAAQVAAVLERDRLRLRSRRMEQVEAGDEMRRSLLAAVSHDLRTPLASIKAGVSSLRQTDVAWSREEQQSLLGMIAESGEELERLIDNLLDLSRLEAGIATPSLRRVSAEEIVWPALPAAGRDRIRVESPDHLPLLCTDPGLLERVLGNLVDNALRYGGERPVEVVVRAVPTGHPDHPAAPTHLEFRVVDHGPGVADTQKETMFEPFRRLGDRRPGGVGLGLAVARGFAQAVGAGLSTRDTPGGGLTMVVSAPLVPPSPGSAPA